MATDKDVLTADEVREAFLSTAGTTWTATADAINALLRPKFAAAEAAALEKAAALVKPRANEHSELSPNAKFANAILALITPEQRSALVERLDAARLEEANWWAKAHGQCDEPTEVCRWIHERIAALERTQHSSGPEAGADAGGGAKGEGR